MKVLFTASESAPFFKTGGLGDVTASLPKELVCQGIDVRVALPLHSKMKMEDQEELELIYEFSVRVGWEEKYCGVKSFKRDGVIYYFIDNLEYFFRDELYGYDDDGERYSFFSMAVIEMMEKIEFIPDIIHCNDWHTALIPALLKDKYHWIDAYQKIRTVFTIHNLRFQGIFGRNVLYDWLGTGDNIFHENGIEYYGDVNFLKAGVNFADIVTTVSPSYAEEIQTAEFGEGLDGVLRRNSWKLSGILNGIDYEVNDPQTDSSIVKKYSKESLAGKLANKRALQNEFHLPESDDLLIGVVSRLTYQKGMHLLNDILEGLGALSVQLVVLGTGEEEFEQSFKYFEERFPNKIRAVIDFDVELAQRIYAGSDLFLMPSAFEPCGLSQMIAMRYGTLPLVHEVGGLKDTVEAYNQYTGEGTGFSFNNFSSYTLYQSVLYAVEIYQDQEIWEALMKQAMEKDFSWTESAKDYIAHYQSITQL